MHTYLSTRAPSHVIISTCMHPCVGHSRGMGSFGALYYLSGLSAYADAAETPMGLPPPL